MHGVVQSYRDRAGQCSQTLIGFTTVGAAASKYGSAAGAIVATPTARANARRSADANRCGVPGRATSGAIAARLGTRPVRMLGVGVEHRK